MKSWLPPNSPLKQLERGEEIEELERLDVILAGLGQGVAVLDVERDEHAGIGLLFVAASPSRERDWHRRASRRPDAVCCGGGPSPVERPEVMRCRPYIGLTAVPPTSLHRRDVPGQAVVEHLVREAKQRFADDGAAPRRRDPIVRRRQMALARELPHEASEPGVRQRFPVAQARAARRAHVHGAVKGMAEEVRLEAVVVEDEARSGSFARWFRASRRRSRAGRSTSRTARSSS